MEKSVCGQFLLNGSNGITEENCFSYYSPAVALPR